MYTASVYRIVSCDYLCRKRKVTTGTPHVAWNPSEGDEKADPGCGTPQETEAFDDRASRGRLIKATHNLVKEGPGDYALRVASDRRNTCQGGTGGDEATRPTVTIRQSG